MMSKTLLTDIWDERDRCL